MTILCDVDLFMLINEHGLIVADDEWANRWGGPLHSIQPASVDIHVGRTIMVDTPQGFIEATIDPARGYVFDPGEFALVPTLETFNVPNGYAMDLRLKSSMARIGWDHSLAFWVDPGWHGVLTMEIRNTRRYAPLVLMPGQLFAQVIVHKLSGKSAFPYSGRYNGAASVEEAKL